MQTDSLGRSGRFEELRELLRSSGYTEEFLCGRFGLKRAEQFDLDRGRRGPLSEAESAADVLTALYLAGEFVSLEQAERLVGRAGVGLLSGMGLLEMDAGGGRCHGTVALYPLADLHIASDRWSNPDNAPFEAPNDTVYPAFIPNTRLFLAHVPLGECGSFLDLCAGTGIAAILAARQGAREAWAGDIAERCTRFAEFNGRLNGVAHFHAVTSDLYESLSGRAFDRIVAHPPYVPVLKPKWIFFSGGEDGEEITRRIVEGLPAHLNDHGVFLALTMGSDRSDAPFEWRIREWLGEDGRDFDIALIVRKIYEPHDFALRNREESEAWKKLFARLGVESLVYGVIAIQRRTGARETFTVRRQASPGRTRAPWEWLLAWESAAKEDLTRLILERPLHRGSDTEFQVRHRLEGSAWTPQRYTLRTERPFSMECDAHPWMANLIALCDGRATGRDQLRVLVENGVLPQGIAEEEFARAAAGLVSGGFIEVEGFRPPRAEG
ncbi:MAG TPA: class I SAM-dependent methyltransferase [Bryobacteraceae bacterium]|nr:class I SAM-dependent methyltransferase [Bryobacteraceae bacterium]